MATYCWQCSKDKDLPRSAMRTSRADCQFCGAPGPNYTYPTGLLIDDDERQEAQAERQ